MLTREILMQDQTFRSVAGSYRKPISIIFVVYEIDEKPENLNASTQPEVFEELINSGKATPCSSTSDFIISSIKQLKKNKPKKAKVSPLKVAGIIAATTLVVGSGVFIATYKLMQNQIKRMSSPANYNGGTTEDGLLIPKQEDIPDSADQITVTIDRSYSPVPVEDLQLKGAVHDGKAKIQLPAFDKEDFFNHVTGYSWGFTSDPNGEKIEYYGGKEYSFSQDTKLYRVLVKYGGGSGTQEDPYLIDYFDQLELLSEEKARGYFKQIDDISFPAWCEHKPIDTINELKADPKSEYFEYDGGNYVISGLTQPLFGKVSGSVIKNVNIRNAVIKNEDYKDYGILVCNVYNYRYKAADATYETGETLIQHCSVSHSGITLALPESEQQNGESAPVVTTMEVVPPDLIEYDEEGNPIEASSTTEPVTPTKTADYSVGAISGNGGRIEDCYVTDFGIYNKLPDYILYCGGISGKPANVINSSVYYFSTNGNIFYAGGIAGSAAGSGLYDADGKELPAYFGGSIQGCGASRLILNSEVAAGGIAGVGGTKAKNALISNNYANNISFKCGIFAQNNEVIEEGITGGIFGTDASTGNGHLITNTVSIANYPVIGQKAKSKYDETVRMAPEYAFYQENIQTVVNKNTVNPANPKEIFTGSFTFKSGLLTDDTGALAYP
ncbi:MAG: hypothetical protein IKG82_04375, partial [Oscillospiraceae bacterium]|nr:hypothetical protein [Oscillospiraceae bacterium]